MDPIDHVIAAKFAAFEREQEPARAEEALHAIRSAEPDLPAETTLAHWLLFFAVLDRNIDATWDPNDRPETGIIPPPADGIAYFSGVDPAAIADPAARSEYERALAASKEHARRYNAQLQLRRIDERATAAAGRTLADAPDLPKAEELLAASPLSDARKETLRRLMGAGA